MSYSSKMSKVYLPHFRRRMIFLIFIVAAFNCIILLALSNRLSVANTPSLPAINSPLRYPTNAVSYLSEETNLDRYDIWPPFDVRIMSHDVFKRKCLLFDEDLSIATLPDLLLIWSRSSFEVCRELYDIMNSVYVIDKETGSVRVSETFQKKIRNWLGGKDELYQELFHQEMIHVMNRYTKESIAFNPLRGKRPVMKMKLEESEEDYLTKITKETSASCDFCRYKNFTAEDVFGRVESPLSFSASNIFKLEPFHAIIAMREHHPVNWSFEQYMDMMELTKTWLRKAYKELSETIYPSLAWDLLPKSGASQLHPHCQVFLSSHWYQGNVEVWRRAGQDYFSAMKRNYFTDLIRLYSALGLSVHYKSAVALATLTPRKDHEVIVIAPKANGDFFQLIYYVFKAFRDDLKRYSFSLGGGYPALGKGAREGRIPAFVRIASRGALTEMRADMSGLGLFLATNVYVDPYDVAKIVRESVQKQAPPSTNPSAPDS